MANEMEPGVPEDSQKWEAPDTSETTEENIQTEKEAERSEENSQDQGSEGQENKEEPNIEKDARDLADEIFEFSKDLSVDKTHVEYLVGRIKEDPVKYGAFFLALEKDPTHADGTKAIEKKFGRRIDDVLELLDEKRLANR